MPQYRILSMDGGYGWNTATLLQMVNNRLPQGQQTSDLLDNVDLFTGVSAGGMNSLFFASKDRPTEALGEITQFWQQVNQSALRGLLPSNFLAGVAPEQVLQGDPQAVGRLLSNVQQAVPELSPQALATFNPFDPTNIYKMMGAFWNLWGAAVHLGMAAVGATSLFSSNDLRQFFTGYFGADMKLGDLKKKVSITAFQLDNGEPGPLRSWKPKVYHNFPRQVGTEPDLDELVVDVALRTAAAPVEEPIYQGMSGTGPGFVDGGVVANNPAMIGLAQALAAGVRLEDVLLFSVSTGRNLVTDTEFLAPTFAGGVAPWGYGKWLFDPAKPLALIEMLLEASTDAVVFQTELLLGTERAHRLSPPLQYFNVPNDPLTTALIDASVSFLETSGWLTADHLPLTSLRIRAKPVSVVQELRSLRTQVPPGTPPVTAGPGVDASAPTPPAPTLGSPAPILGSPAPAPGSPAVRTPDDPISEVQ
ncbi:MAG TPA: patatin-like phospholipase family protein [Longimicrobium sp.]|jgi:hypothetical protein